MQYDYRRLFMGTRIAIYNYATKAAGGYIDVDSFEYSKRKQVYSLSFFYFNGTK